MPSPHDILDLVVIGAGPHALTVAAYLAEIDRSAVERLLVLDPDGWLARWRAYVSAYDIPILRSARVHHPHPSPYALMDYARASGRSSEFHGIIGRPSVGLFDDFCSHLITRYGLEGRLLRARATGLVPHPGGCDVMVRGGHVIHARSVVLCTNPSRPRIPSWCGDAWARYPGVDGLRHADDVVLGRDARRGDRVVVVGGGLTGAQLVEGAHLRGCEVTWMTRRALTVRDLDVSAAWLGPALGQFHGTPDPLARLAMVRRARGGGSVPDAERRRLEALCSGSTIRHLSGIAVTGVDRSGSDSWRVHGRRAEDGRRVVESADQVWLATGHRASVRTEPLLRRCRRRHPVRVAGGLPDLREDLTWGGLPVRMTGTLSALSVGPTARTVIGARMAAERIVAALAPEAGLRLPRQYPHPRSRDGSGRLSASDLL